jgi:hypothetical protein
MRAGVNASPPAIASALAPCAFRDNVVIVNQLSLVVFWIRQRQHHQPGCQYQNTLPATLISIRFSPRYIGRPLSVLAMTSGEPRGLLVMVSVLCFPETDQQQGASSISREFNVDATAIAGVGLINILPDLMIVVRRHGFVESLCWSAAE